MKGVRGIDEFDEKQDLAYGSREDSYEGKLFQLGCIGQIPGE